MFRAYEDPRKLEEQLEKVKEQIEANPDDIDLYQEKADLEERINFAWQDDEFDCLYAREHWRDDPEYWNS